MGIVPLKRCASCREWWERSAFHRSKQTKDGLFPYCRRCANERSRAAHHAHREARLAVGQAYRERTRGTRTEAQRAHRREWERRYRRENPEKRAALQSSWKARNRERITEYQRRWMDQNRDRVRETVRRRYARKAAGTIVPFSIEQLRARLSMWGNRCWMCGSEATSVDHVKPLAKDGAHALCNLRPSCHPCNQSKGDRWPLGR